MVNRNLCKWAVLLICLGQMVFPFFSAVANIHPLAGVTDKNTAGIQDIDITISLDWDPAVVAGNEANPRGYTKAEFQDVIESYAQSVFAMTNGRHRIRNVYVFTKKAYWDLVDVRIISTQAGRCGAHVSYWKKVSGSIEIYVYENYDKQKNEWAFNQYPGPVLAHECGHYIYGVFDEYREMGEKGKTIAQLKKENDLSWPAKDDDGTQQSIMNGHDLYPNWFSVQSAYHTAVSKNSAQYRMFEKSIWDTLTSDPRGDHENARNYQRIWFDAFKNMKVVSEKDRLAKQYDALAGYDEAPLKIVWMKDTFYLLLVLDNTTPVADWSKTLNMGASAVNATKAGDLLSVLVGNRVVIDKTQITAANKSGLILQVSSLGQGSASSVENSLKAALAQINQYRTETGTEATYLVYLLTAGNPSVSVEVGKMFASAKALLEVASFSQESTKTEQFAALQSKENISVAEVARLTGGRTNISWSSLELESLISRALGAMQGDNSAGINAQYFPELLKDGASQAMPFKIGPQDKMVEVALLVAEEDWNHARPSLVDPAGHVIAQTSLPAGVTLENDPDAGVWVYSIDPALYSGAQGIWSAKITATAQMKETLAMYASSESPLSFAVEVAETPLFGYVARAYLAADRPIINARVTASIFNREGDVLEKLTLLDNGLNGDVKAGDGIYSARIVSAPRDEEHDIVAWADDNNGQALESDRNKALVSNDYVNETPTGAFQRTDECSFIMTLSGSESSSRCFIAEAAYRTPLDPHVDALRAFRDRFLLTNGPGRMLVRFYYMYSPDWAAFIRKHEMARGMARGVLTPVVYVVRYPLYSAVLFLTVMILVGYRMRRKSDA
jgi:hypothetical protein